MPTHTTRRTMLAGAASVPIAAMAGAAPVSASPAADQKLFEIEAKVRELRSRWQPLNRLTEQAHALKDHARQDELEAEFNKLVCQAADLCEEAIDTRAATMEGIYSKARLIKIDAGDPDALAHSIVDDLLAMQGRAGS